YARFFSEGTEKVSTVEEYHSHNTFRLDKECLKKLLLKLDFIREDIKQRNYK
ncbi:MAG: UDP-glucose 4-epimerase, partial [Bacteroidales bacterium]|nr:UDP-glucose 4-epimerase [Bacteroidales bacterium]